MVPAKTARPCTVMKKLPALQELGSTQSRQLSSLQLFSLQLSSSQFFCFLWQPVTSPAALKDSGDQRHDEFGQQVIVIQK